MFKETGWRSDLDEELRRFFAGDFVGEAGLCSKFGSQLDKVRDGVNYGAGGSPMTFLGADSHGPAMWTRSDLPARVVEFGRSGLAFNRVIEAFRSMQLTVTQAAIDAASKRFVDAFVAKNGRQPNAVDMREFKVGDAMRAGRAKAQRHTEVLQAFYLPRTTNEKWGLLGLDPYAFVAAITKPIVDVTKAWMVERCEAEIDQYRLAVTKSQKEAGDRLDEWDGWRDELSRELGEIGQELASHADDSGAIKVVRLLRRKQLIARQALIPEADAELAAYIARVRAERIPEIDTEGMIRRRWDREPTHDELKEALRRICDAAKSLKTPDLRANAERQKYEALAAAKRELDAARAAYAAERSGGRSDGGQSKKRAPGALSRKQQAILDDFDDRVGIR